MNKFHKRLALSLVFFICVLIGSAQNYASDSQLWCYLSLQKKLNKKFDLHLKLQGRMINNSSELGRASSNFRISYKVYKNIKLLIGYNFTEKKNNKEIYKPRHTYYGGIELKKDFRRFEFSYRNLFMCRYKSPFTSYDGYIAYYYDRHKVTIKYEVSKRLSCYIAEEVNMPLNNPQLKGLSRSRTYAGVDINVKKHQKLELYFMYQQQLQQGDWFNQDISYTGKPLHQYFVYGIGYNISF
ncbi:MAG: DUF2490 domain-containing protein [Burkholderiales bacterium]|nr:DUF2490 domain-containing protein [Bacteroidia bacterium]